MENTRVRSRYDFEYEIVNFNNCMEDLERSYVYGN